MDNINNIDLTENYLDHQKELIKQYKQETGLGIRFTRVSLNNYTMWLESIIIRINQLKKGGFIVTSVYRFPNGNVCVFNKEGNQVPDLQGKYNAELHKKIRYYSNEVTNWQGF